METSPLGTFQITLIIFILSGIVLFALFRLIHFILQYIGMERRQSELIFNILPVAELICWIIWLLWSIQYFYSYGQLILVFPVILLIMIVLFLSWYALKDLTAGIIFKTGKIHQLNDQISVAGISGRISAWGLRTLELEDNNGQMISIPYSRMLGNIISRSYPSQTLLSHNFNLRIKKTRNFDVSAFEMELRHVILTLPWSSQTKEPRINVLEDTEASMAYNITIYSLDETYLKKTETVLLERFKGLKAES
jgi:hypothetical protein